MLDIDKILSRKRGQKDVAEFLLRNGIRISEDGKLYLKDIEIPYTSISRVLKIDRRVVKATVNSILRNSELKRIFTKLDSTPLLRDVAPELGFGAIEIIPTNASEKGIIAGVTKIISDAGISVRQIIAEDPMFENAETTIITERPIPRKLINKMLNVKGVKKVIVLS
ncbi:MAG: amino acid-binding protein [Candidatus Altiarchaeales archaeon]|nr:MAG: amino acid-binding protein [Candidatus Altiarchaeales archaeon]RLI95350.1 MAG: amino acid-binding protein [Candidatus Altiarchaeales archaeon]